MAFLSLLKQDLIGGPLGILFNANISTKIKLKPLLTSISLC